MPDKEKKEILLDKYGDEILTKVKFVYGQKMKRISKTKYKYVYIVSFNETKTYRAELNKDNYGFSFIECFANLRDAALTIDKELMKNRIDPVNILVPRKV